MRRTFPIGETVDFVIVGAGAAGGVLARELSVAGFSVVVLEQGPWLRTKDFRHDELASLNAALTNDYKRQPNTLRESETEVAQLAPAVGYGRCVGGGTVHFTGNYWRFHEIDFVEVSRKGTVSGATLADWPLTYAELEPYYSKVEWEIGVSGLAGASPFDPPRSRPYPLPPLPIHSKGVLAERAAKKLGWTAFPAPMAILSQPYRGRSACINCGFCEYFGCEMEAKSSTLVSMIPDALATGRCEIRPDSYVRKIEVDQRGRVTGVKYFDAKKREIYQKARAVVVSANGAETPRLLLHVEIETRFPTAWPTRAAGRAQSDVQQRGVCGWAVRRCRSTATRAWSTAESFMISTNSTLHWGLHGGGGLDMRFDFQPIAFALYGQGDSAPRWGADFKRRLHQRYTHTAYVLGHSTSLPVETNSISARPYREGRLGPSRAAPHLQGTSQRSPAL